MKLISFAGQAILLIAILAALIFQLDLAQVKYKLWLVLSIVGVSGSVALIGCILLVRKYFVGENVRADLVGLLLLCMVPSILFLFAVGPEGLMAPALDDISTDTQNPPVLAYAEANRDRHDNLAVYPKDLVSQQLRWYPEIKTLSVALPSRDAFHISIFTASMLGWRILNWDSRTGQIDLRETTRYFAFKSDIAIRITPVDALNSNIDVRSVSLKPGRDFGFNARRINSFFTVFNAELKKRQKH